MLVGSSRADSDLSAHALPSPPDSGYFTRYTVADLAAALRAGRVSPVELVEQVFAAADRLDPVINSFVTLDPVGAREAAARATAELADGVDRGPLHGIPVAVKDLIDTAGLRTTMGARHFLEHVPDRDAECVRRLRAAGAIVVGKTTTHQYAFGATGDRSATGPTHNPYRPDRMSGGSSGGSAAAVAAGMVPLAVGTDTGGSVRIPAALCGLVGLRPTQGVVSTDGVFPLSPSLDTVGPMARTAADCRALWRVLAGNGQPNRAEAERPPRIGWLSGMAPTEPAVGQLARSWLDELAAALGASVSPAECPDPELMIRIYRTVQGWEVHKIHAERIAEAADDYDDEVLDLLRALADVSAEAYQEALGSRRRAQDQVGELLVEFDLLALPTVGVVAPPIGERAPVVAGQREQMSRVLLLQTLPWSVAGVPALSLPAGTLAGLPVGLQLVGPPGGEELLLDVAERADELRAASRASALEAGAAG